MSTRVSFPLAGLLVLTLACGVPSRPPNVPEGAFWGGDRKTGAFVLVDAKEPLGWKLRIYDRKGKLLKEGRFILVGTARAELFPGEIAGFDGQRLHFKDGAQLVPRP